MAAAPCRAVRRPAGRHPSLPRSPRSWAARGGAARRARSRGRRRGRSEEHTSELQSLMRISYAVFCLKKKKQIKKTIISNTQSTKENTAQESDLSDRNIIGKLCITRTNMIY